MTTSADHIRRVCGELCDLLLAKNAAYGDSALNPVRILSTASPVEQILVRIDDKLSRIARGHAAGEDVERDLAGYFVLLLVARELEGERPACADDAHRVAFVARYGASPIERVDGQPCAPDCEAQS